MRTRARLDVWSLGPGKRLQLAAPPSKESLCVNPQLDLEEARGVPILRVVDRQRAEERDERESTGPSRERASEAKDGGQVESTILTGTCYF